jgi:thiol-disulfide isomerase/thioredoxin
MSYTPHNFNQVVSKAKVIEITDNLPIILKDVYPKVLYFTAKWCGPCQRISPVYKNLAEANPGIKFFKIDVDENKELSEIFGISAMPTFFFFRSKTDYKTFSGADSNKLNQYVNDMIT